MTTYIQLRFSIRYHAVRRFVDVLTVAAVRVVTTRTSSLWSREVLFTGGGQSTCADSNSCSSSEHVGRPLTPRAIDNILLCMTDDAMSLAAVAMMDTPDMPEPEVIAPAAPLSPPRARATEALPALATCTSPSPSRPQHTSRSVTASVESIRAEPGSVAASKAALESDSPIPVLPAAVLEGQVARCERRLAWSLRRRCRREIAFFSFSCRLTRLKNITDNYLNN
jgi:hypothetical protein